MMREQLEAGAPKIVDTYDMPCPFGGVGQYAYIDGRKEGYPTLGERIRDHRTITPETMHSITYLTFLADRTKVDTSFNLLCDSGLLHRATHWLRGSPNLRDSIELMAQHCDELQGKVEEHYGTGLHI